MQSLGILISQINAEYGDGGLYARSPHWNVYLVSPELVALGGFVLYISVNEILIHHWSSQKSQKRRVIGLRLPSTI